MKYSVKSNDKKSNPAKENVGSSKHDASLNLAQETFPKEISKQNGCKTLAEEMLCKEKGVGEECEVKVLRVESTTNIVGISNKSEWIRRKTQEPKSLEAVKGSSEGEHKKGERKRRVQKKEGGKWKRRAKGLGG